MTENAKEDLKKKLTPLQFHVTQQCGTEPPFNNQFWNNKKPGIYVDGLRRAALLLEINCRPPQAREDGPVFQAISGAAGCLPSSSSPPITGSVAIPILPSA